MDSIPSKKETKGLSMDKTKNGSPRVDTSVTVAPMNMSRPNKTRVETFPLTPPDEKRSVSFDPSVTTLSIPNDTYINLLNGYIINSPVESIDISVHDCDEEIYVALIERDTEMKELVVRNQEFFDTIKQSMFEDDKKWEKFLEVLYSKREDNPDSKWMESISEYLADNPHLLASFKQITGYIEHDHENTEEEDIQEEYDDHYTCAMSESVYVDITPIRNFPYVLKNLEKSYPQFFINAKNELGKLSKEMTRRGSTLGRNHLSNDNPHLHPNAEDQSSDDDSSETLFDELKRILIAPRSEMNDIEWETAINECLDPWPTLIEQLEEILISEIRQNTYEE